MAWSHKNGNHYAVSCLCESRRIEGQGGCKPHVGCRYGYYRRVCMSAESDNKVRPLVGSATPCPVVFFKS